jgi:hypothetical protein
MTSRGTDEEVPERSAFIDCEVMHYAMNARSGRVPMTVGDKQVALNGENCAVMDPSIHGLLPSGIACFVAAAMAWLGFASRKYCDVVG